MQQRFIPRRQKGAATLLFLLISGLAMLAATAAAIYAISGSQKIQYAQHTSTQADMSAWDGVSLLSAAVRAMPAASALQEGQAVKFSGTQPGIAATYLGKSGTNLLFKVTGSSAGATSTLLVAIKAPQAGGGTPGKDLSTVILRGSTTIQGDIKYVGPTPLNLHVIDGDLSLSGSVSGLGTVCATGNITITSAISVENLCSNGNITMSGSSTVKNVDAVGNVELKGGASGAIGTINANGYVTLSGGSAAAGTINSGSYVTVSGGNAQASIIRAMGNIDWSSNATADILQSNGDVKYSTSAGTSKVDIRALGRVYVTAAKTVNALSSVTLTGYYGQGVTGVLNAGGLLGGSSWGSGGGAVAASGTVDSIVSPYPASVKVTVKKGYAPSVPYYEGPNVPTFSSTPITIDVYPLKSSSNLAFTGVDSYGNIAVTASNINGVPDGNYRIADYAGKANFLCAAANAAGCTSAPLLKVCQGFSDSNDCFSFSNGTWSVQGKQMEPYVLWFQGNLTIGSGTWVNTFLATGNVSTTGQNAIYSPYYEEASVVCTGAANSAHEISALTSFGMNPSFYPKQLCESSTAYSENALGSAAIIAGGYVNGSFVGGSITLGASTKVFGYVLAGQFINTGGSTSVSGPVYASGQGGTSSGGNGMQGSTTITFTGGSSSYKPGVPPCMTSSCQSDSETGNNIVWAGGV